MRAAKAAEVAMTDEDLAEWLRLVALSRSQMAGVPAAETAVWQAVAAGAASDAQWSWVRDFAAGRVETGPSKAKWAAVLAAQLAEGSATARPAPQVYAKRASEIVERPMEIDLLQHLQLPRGELTLFAGDAATCKSTLAYQCATEFTHREGGGNVLVLSEESLDKTVVARLRREGADLDRVYVENFTHFQLDNAGLARLSGYALDCGITMIVVDPLSGWLLNVDTNAEGDVRGALDDLHRVIDANDMLLIGILHHAKRRGRGAMGAVLGSTAFPAMARAHWTFAEDPEDPDTIEVAAAKFSWGRRPETQRYRRDSLPGSDGKLPRLTWYGEGGRTADEMTSEPQGGKRGPKGKVDEVLDQIRHFMKAAKPTFKSKIVRHLVDAGVARRTAYRGISRMIADQELVEADGKKDLLVLDERSVAYTAGWSS